MGDDDIVLISDSSAPAFVWQDDVEVISTGAVVHRLPKPTTEKIHGKSEISFGSVRFSVYFPRVIMSFADILTEKLFLGEELSRKEINKLGSLDRIKAFERLAILNEADQKTLMLIPALHYHKLKGTSKHSIDADSRKSPWRITFQWENAEMKNVELVRIEDTH